MTMTRFRTLALMAAVAAFPAMHAAASDFGSLFEGGLSSLDDSSLTTGDFKASSSALTASPTVKATPSVFSTPAAGTLDYDVDGLSGHVYIVANNATVSSYDLESSNNNANGTFIRANWQKIPAFSGTLSGANQSYELDQEAPPGSTVVLDGVYDLGQIIPAGLDNTQAKVTADLTDPGALNNGPSSYGLASGATVNANTIFINVPEPTSLALGGVFGLACLSRKRRSK